MTRRWAVLDEKTETLYGEEAAVVQDPEAALAAYPSRKPLRVPSHLRGLEIVNETLFNKGTSFEYGERDRLGLRGLLPPVQLTMEEQLRKTMATLRALPDDISKHVFLSDLLDRNTTL